MGAWELRFTVLEHSVTKTITAGCCGSNGVYGNKTYYEKEIRTTRNGKDTSVFGVEEYDSKVYLQEK